MKIFSMTGIKIKTYIIGKFVKKTKPRLDQTKTYFHPC